MSELSKALDETIQNLEKIRDTNTPPSDALLTQLDVLYGQQLQLIQIEINSTTPEYLSATNAMSEAANQTQQALNDISNLEHTIDKVATAVSKVSKLLTKFA